MIQHDVTSTQAFASRHTIRQRRHRVGILFIVSGGMVLTCIALSFLPNPTTCTLWIQCGTWYPLIPFGVLFVAAGIVLARSRAAPFTDEEALSRQLYREILSEYARGWVILKILVSMFLILGGASLLFAPSRSFAWVLPGVGILGVLLGLGVLVHAGLTPGETRHIAAVCERERLFASRLRAITTGRTSEEDS
jgi:hypothetical protein